MKYVYAFEDGKGDMKSLLGGKGANLAEMMRIGLPVPPGFTITTEVCNKYYEDGGQMSDEVMKQVFDNLEALEAKTDKILGGTENPLLVSVRSGAAISMPGMMDTVLNLGMNDVTVEKVAELTGNRRFAMDSYRRFIQMFGDVVLEIEKYQFDRVFEGIKADKGVENDVDLDAQDLIRVIEEYKVVVRNLKGFDFPQDPKKQLEMAIEAVFSSWNNPRAIIYRNANEIPHNLGTAVNVQSMVFGNMGDDSGTGVAFTRNPSTGEKALFGEFLMNAQGEDVVAGIRTPLPVSKLQEKNPVVYDSFLTAVNNLENHYRDMQDIEFTIEKGKLYFLQTRTGKRTANAAVNIAVDMVEEGLINKEEAIMRINPKDIDKLLHPTFDEKGLEEAKLLSKGLPASPGAASGQVCFYSEDVVAAAAKGIKTILVRTETSPEDIEGMISSEGILTARGGMTSHAAVVARGMGKCCVAGCSEIHVEEQQRFFRVGTMTFKEGDFISLDGNTGSVYEGVIPTTEVALTGSFGQLMEWADDVRTMGVRTNADTAHDAQAAVDFGAEGIGLCRTEHMFFEEDRISIVRKMIVARDLEERMEALDKLQPIQRGDFVGIFKAMGSRPVTVRLLDPPLHEFLPHEKEDIEALAKDMNMATESLEEIVNTLKEFNPMLGHRGCRLAITYPEIYMMQCRAIFEAIIQVSKEEGIDVHPEIMIPLVGHDKELSLLGDMVRELGNTMLSEAGVEIPFKVGTMIEVPRAALTADEIAKHAEFFSFGTNDLTQMTLGFSRDDAGKFIGEYRNKEIFMRDPFESIDQRGVGKLMKIAVDLARSEKPGLKIGICGEHGGEPASIEFCQTLGFDYVSCSPYRVPIARLSAAQAAIKNKA